MQAYWVEFTDGTAGCCEGQSPYDAKRIAEHVTGKTVQGGKWKDFAVEPLPYPATPAIWQHDHPVVGKCPTFCHQPAKCKGRSSCPREIACSE